MFPTLPSDQIDGSSMQVTMSGRICWAAFAYYGFERPADIWSSQPQRCLTKASDANFGPQSDCLHLNRFRREFVLGEGLPAAAAAPVMDSRDQFVVPEGYYPPFTIISDENQTGWILIATLVGLSMVLISTIIRITVRASLKQRYALDDILLGIGTICAVVYESVLIIATTKGLGKAAHLVDPANLESLQKCRYAVQIYSVLGLGFAKGSVSAFVIQITPVKSHRRYIHCITAACILWSILAMLLWALKCDLRHPWIYIREQCGGITARFTVICVLDIVTELLIFSSTAMLVFNLQTSLANKSIVLVAFGSRLPLIAFIVLRMMSYKFGNNVPDTTLHSDMYAVWTVTEVNYSLISASIPLIRPFVSGLSTNYGVGAVRDYTISAVRPNAKGDTSMLSTLQSQGKGHQNPSKQFTARSGSCAGITPSQGESQEAYDCIQGGVTETYAYHPQTPPGPSKVRESNSRVGTPVHDLAPAARGSDCTEIEDPESKERPQKIVITKQVSWQIFREDADG